MYNLQVQIGREQLAAQIIADIESASVALYSEERRSHLGGSEIGKPCSRMLYYKFRWCWEEKFIGRMLRLFNVGHREEERFVTYLRAIGFQVWDKDPDTGKQFRMTESCKGHHGGGNDARAIAPERYGIGDQLLLCEFKSINLKHFTALKKARSVAAYFPEYYAQICEYGYKANINFAVFMGTNKNDSELYCEIVPLNHNFGQSLEVKAHEIVFSRVPPPRISENPADGKCTYCFARQGCFFGQPVEINCRSCQHSEPVDNAEWYCHLHKGVIPKTFIPTGCASHLGITSQ